MKGTEISCERRDVGATAGIVYEEMTKGAVAETIDGAFVPTAK